MKARCRRRLAAGDARLNQVTAMRANRHGPPASGIDTHQVGSLRDRLAVDNPDNTRPQGCPAGLQDSQTMAPRSVACLATVPTKEGRKDGSGASAPSIGSLGLRALTRVSGVA
jgi:hypothetical protein